MKKNLFIFLAGMLTCLSIISVSGFITSPTKPENKPAVVASAPQTPKPHECDCVEYILSPIVWGKRLTPLNINNFTNGYNALILEQLQAIEEKKCIILKPTE